MKNKDFRDIALAMIARKMEEVDNFSFAALKDGEDRISLHNCGVWFASLRFAVINGGETYKISRVSYARADILEFDTVESSLNWVSSYIISEDADNEDMPYRLKIGPDMVSVRTKDGHLTINRPVGDLSKMFPEDIEGTVVDIALAIPDIADCQVADFIKNIKEYAN